MRNGKIRRFRPRSHNKHGSRRQGHQSKSNGIHQINNHRNNFRGNTTKNPQNLERLIEKYRNLAKEALSSGDEILKQNYLQHSDHFSRVLSEVNENKLKNSNDDHDSAKNNSNQSDTISNLEEKK